MEEIIANFKMRRILQAIFIILIISYLGCDKKDNPKASPAKAKAAATAAATPKTTPTPEATPTDDEDDNEGEVVVEIAEELNKLDDPEDERDEDEDEVEVSELQADRPDQVEELETVGETDDEDAVDKTTYNNNDEPFLTSQEIQQLNSTGSNSKLIGGVVSGSGSKAPSVSNFTPEDIEDDSGDPDKDDEEDETELPYVDGQSRGYVILNLMQPNARNSVRMQLSTMYHAKIKHLFLGVLIDGTFSWDFPWISSVVRELNKDGRRLTLALYITNGPTMRKFDTTPIRTSFSRMSPDEFRERIRWDTTVRSQFQSLARRAQQVFSLNKQANPRNTNIAVIQLEDNLDNESFVAARDLARQVLAPDVILARNPCLGCWDGNDAYGHGTVREFHNPGELAIYGGFGFTLDGVGFHHTFESGSGPNTESVKGLIGQSMQKGVKYFGLWRHDRQGLVPGTDIHPDQRNYAVPTRQQIDAEIELLRFGLRETS